MARYLYSELASTLQAYKHCTSPSANASQAAYADKHEEMIDSLVKRHMPSGSGFDCGTRIHTSASHAEKLVFITEFHHMNDCGMYDGWTEHKVTVTPSFSGFNIRISGSNRNDIKEYIHESFSTALMTDLAAIEAETNPFKVGNRVTWNDPDNGLCTRTLTIASFEFQEDDAVTIVDTDGNELEAYKHEVKNAR